MTRNVILRLKGGIIRYAVVGWILLSVVQADEVFTTHPAPPPNNETVTSTPHLDLFPTNPYDQNNLGWMYQQGKGGLPRDDAEAVKWFQISAMQGNAYGQANLGAMYESGKGVPYNPTEALQWYRRAAAQGNGYAQTALARLQNRIGN